jgi:hypothetical protein
MKTHDSIWLFLAIVTAVCLYGLWQREYDVSFYPTGKNELRMNITHPLKRDAWVKLHWSYDVESKEQGWCAWYAARGEQSTRWHIVMTENSEHISIPPPEVWRN